ncbi:adenylate/guanylate cyclase [Methylobacterium aquaticum]|uniref:Adenylate/guanylate cyclase n=2 Tax=Methylobacterium aquaticum TaxID=270351 RepID=A0A0J6SRX8_9HYPH|nr:adenylate/guanylate cyclase [Methylobacterium aquaticum]
MSALSLPEACAEMAGARPRLRRARAIRADHSSVARSLAAWAAGRGALLAAAPMPLLLGLAAATAPEPVTLGLAGLALAWLSLRVRHLRRAGAEAIRQRSNLARLTAPEIARLIAESDPVAPHAGWEQEATVLFADIRGFTRLCEGLAPADVAVFLAEFRLRAARAVEAAGGLVDKFVGDEAMAVFGVAESASGDADRAVAAARALAAAMQDWSRERERAGLPPVRIGIGLHRGPVFVGAIGARRVEFTAVGDTVNVARRLEQMTRTLACDCLVSEAVLRAAACGEARVAAVQPVRGARTVRRLYALRLETGRTSAVPNEAE